MPTFAVPGGWKLAYDILGEGDPIVLVHGFASSRAVNWKGTGWYDTLIKAGRQVIAFDVRGHGESDKPHEHRAYDEGELGADVVRLLDHLGISRADVMGYSMGGYITLRVLHDNPERVRRAIVAGVGDNYYGRGRLQTDAIAAGLRAKSAADVEGAMPKTFRAFAEQGRNDLEALALCMTRERHSFTAEEFAGLRVPVLIVVGDKDVVTGPPTMLADAVPGSRVVLVPGRDHMSSVGDKVYKSAVLAFLSEA